MNLSKFSIAVIFGFLGLAFWLWYGYVYLLDFPLFLADNQGSSLGLRLFMIAYGYATLTGGVFLGSVYRRLKISAHQDSIHIGEIMKAVFRGTDFWLGLFASPVVYIILLQAIDLETVSLVAFGGITLVGLQNGFVCNVVADTMIGGTPKANPVEGGH